MKKNKTGNRALTKPMFPLAMLAATLAFGLTTVGCVSAPQYATDDLVYKDVVKGGGDYIEVDFGSNNADEQWKTEVTLVSIDGHTIPAKYPGSVNIAVPDRGPLNLKVHLTVEKLPMDLKLDSGNLLGSLVKAGVNAGAKAVTDAAQGRKEMSADFDLVIPQLPNGSKVTVQYWEADMVGAESASGLKELAGGEGDALSNQFLLVSIPAKKDDISPAPTAVKIKVNLAGKEIWGLQAIRL